MDMDKVIAALEKVRVPAVCEETAIHQAIRDAFDEAAIHYRHEYRVRTGKRFDFWVRGIVIEVKKSKPIKRSLIQQLRRYTSVPAVKAVIIISQKTVELPSHINGKRVVSLSLNKNWGLAV